MLRTGSAGRKLALLAVGGLLIFATASSSADSFSVNLVSQTSNTITLGWSPQPGYGYLFSAGGNLVSRTNDPNRTSVRFSKVASGVYDIDVIVKGANGHCCNVPPPPSGAISQTIVNGSTIPDIKGWRAVYDANGDGVEDDPGSVQFLIDGTQVLAEVNAPFGDTFASGSPSTTAGQHTFLVRALNDGGAIIASNTILATVAGPPLPPTGYPNASTTGIPAGTTLTPYSGTLTVSTAGTIVNAMNVTGDIWVKANNVTVKNSRTDGIILYDNHSGLVVQDTEIDCQGSQGSKGFQAGADGGGGGDPASGFTATRLNVHSCEDAFFVGGNFTVSESYIHDPSTTGSDPHNDGFQIFGGSGVNIVHNNIRWRDTSDIQFCNNTGCGQMSNTLIKDNLLYLASGGAYNLYCPKVATSNFQIVHNAFDEAGRGGFGYSTDCGGESSSGNFLYPSGNPYTP
jgi:hypothetical protein